MRTVIIANLSAEQLSYLRNLANENGITADFIVEAVLAEEEEQSVTPITGEMLDAIATQTEKSVLEIATLASQWGITTIEDALAHSEVPFSIKELLESYL